jgi:hypothetical protein
MAETATLGLTFSLAVFETMTDALLSEAMDAVLIKEGGRECRLQELGTLSDGGARVNPAGKS